MAQYELTFLLEKEEEAQKMKELLTNFPVKIIKEDVLGKRNFAFPIRKLHAGYYFTWTIELPSRKLNELRKKLSYFEQLMRYLLLLSE